jgi:hypothetical protein
MVVSYYLDTKEPVSRKQLLSLGVRTLAIDVANRDKDDKLQSLFTSRNYKHHDYVDSRTWTDFDAQMPSFDE